MLEPPRRGGSSESFYLCFGAKIRKIGIPLQTPVFLYKSGHYFCNVHVLTECHLQRQESTIISVIKRRETTGYILMVKLKGGVTNVPTHGFSLNFTNT